MQVNILTGEYSNVNISAIDNGKQIPSISVLEAMKMLVLSWSEVLETATINCFHKAGFIEGTSNEDDHPFSALKSSIDQLRQSDQNLVLNNFIYKDILTVDDKIAVLGGVMINEKK